jgi:hypothetical protein
MPRWTVGQQTLIDRAQNPIEEFSTEVALCDGFAGVSRVLDHLDRVTAGPRSRHGNRVLSLTGQCRAHAIADLAHRAGLDSGPNAGQLRLARKALLAIRKQDQRPLTIMLEDAHMMSAGDMERVVLTLEHICRTAQIPCRLMLVCYRVAKWNRYTMTREMQWPVIPSRFKGFEITDKRTGKKTEFPGRLVTGTIVQITRAGLDALRAEEAASLFTPTTQQGSRNRTHQDHSGSSKDYRQRQRKKAAG